MQPWMIVEVSVEDEYEGLNVTGVKSESKQICRLIMLCIFYCLFELHLQKFPVHRIQQLCPQALCQTFQKAVCKYK